MTSEELERAMQFILEQHAQLASKVDALVEVQHRAEERWARTETSVRALLANSESHEGEIAALREAVREAQAATDRQMAKTDERINALIAVFERHISDGHGGQS
jgi:fructoselysine-6-P-deglycase FrlB-like protein